ncbi:MAG: hypothetical protein GY940_31765, partial [bacterium]|nr:hypothetical protein [bacterium]
MIPPLIATLFILVIVYMTYPRFRRRRLSSIRFFMDLPPHKKSKSRLRWGKIRFTLPFFLQLLLLLSLLAALYLMEKKLSGGDETKGLGVWIIVDTSASMSTMQQGETRMAAALREVDQALSNAQKAGQNKDLCFRLSALDLEKRDLLLKGDALAVEQAVSNLEPR